MVNRRSFLALGLGAVVATAFPQLVPIPLDKILVAPPVPEFLGPGIRDASDEWYAQEALQMLRANLNFTKAYGCSHKTAARLPYVQTHGVDMALWPRDLTIPRKAFRDRMLEPAMFVLAHKIMVPPDWRERVYTLDALRCTRWIVSQSNPIPGALESLRFDVRVL